MIVINTLADNAFKYQIILNDETVLPTTFLTSYVFKLSTNSQYNNCKFKGLLINLGVSTQSIDGIGQLKVLQQLNLSVQLDKNIARLANLYSK